MKYICVYDNVNSARTFYDIGNLQCKILKCANYIVKKFPGKNNISQQTLLNTTRHDKKKKKNKMIRKKFDAVNKNRCFVSNTSNSSEGDTWTVKSISKRLTVCNFLIRNT